MPRAVIADALGAIENYSLRDYDPGPPKPGELRIAIKAAGVSFVDVLNALGKYQMKPPVPFIPGSEFAGTVEGLGQDVSGFSIGQPVVAISYGGVFSEAINVPAQTAHHMPEGLSFEEGSVFLVSAQTSWHALVDRGQVKQGETVLVLGAGGATGYAAVQIAKHHGARVIASASTEEKRALARSAGADAAIDARSDSWRDDVKGANDGKPVDIVFDPVGGSATEPAFRSLAYNGRHLVVGFPGGIPSLPTNLALLKGASLVGVNLMPFGIAEPEKAKKNVEQLLKLASQGLFKPVVAQTYPLNEFEDAMKAAQVGKTAGRIVLVMQ